MTSSERYEQAGADPPTWPTTECGGANCHAQIVWAVTGPDERVPVDAEPVRVSSIRPPAERRERPWWVLLTGEGRRTPRAVVTQDGRVLFGRRWVWRRHIDTCCDAGFYRRAAVRRGRRLPP